LSNRNRRPGRARQPINQLGGGVEQESDNQMKNSRALFPAFVLALLAPVIAEVLSGATRLSFIFVLVPEIMVWGCGALIIRELVRKWNAGSTSMVLLALALSVAEEWVIQQTSLAPLPWVSIQYGRLWQVNWIWFLFFLGYESVWVVLVPVQLAELIFRGRRTERWLSNRGLTISAFVFLLGCFLAWFLWTQIARPKTYHVPKYQPPLAQPIFGLIMIAVLAAAAYLLRHLGTRKHSERAVPPAWVAALAGVLLATPWYGLMSLIFGIHHAWPIWMPLAAGCLWAGCCWVIVSYWTASEKWTDLHRLALCFGATAVIMAFGFSGSSGWPRMDMIGKIIINIVAVLGFFLLAKRVGKNPAFPVP
jgi:hypothetical protein